MIGFSIFDLLVYQNFLNAPIYVDFEEFSQCMNEGAGLIIEHWPQAYQELAGRVQLLAPLCPAREHNGLAPHNASVHGFRGLVTSSARPSYLAAQTLLHETGHNRFSSIYDTFRIFLNDEETRAYSPFVKQQRPLYALAHGIFAFLQDLHLSVRLLGKVPQVADLSLERYVDKLRVAVRTGLDNLHTSARLDARGRELTAGFERALAAVC